MSVMSAAEAGQTPDTGQEILPRGLRMAASAADGGGVGPEASSEDEPSEQADQATPARPDRGLRLVSTEVHVTSVRVAREVSTPVRTERASVQRASVQRVAMPGASVQRVRVQRASGHRVSVRQATTAPGKLRLTRRGRRLVTGFVMLVLVITAMLIWTSVAGGAQVPGPGAPVRSVYQGMTQIVVQPGQTLWSIAAAVDPSGDPWTAVQQISDVNALNGAQIQAGQLLWVPRG